MAASVFGVNLSNASGTSWTIDVPPNDTDDLLLVFLSVRNTGATLGVTGYTGISGADRDNDGFTSNWFVKKSTGGETSATVTSSASGATTTSIYVIKGADVSGTALNAIDGSNYVAGAVGATCASPVLSTVTNNCLLLHGIIWDATFATAALTDLNFIANGNSSGGHHVGVSFKGAAGPISTFTWDGSNAANGGTSWVIAVKSAAATPSIRMVDGRARLIRLGGFDTITSSAPNAVVATLASIAMHTAKSTTIQAGQPTSSPWPINGLELTANETLGGTTSWCGAWVDVTSANLSGKIIHVPWGIGGTISATHVAANGMIVAFADASNNYYAYQLLPQLNWKTQFSGTTTLRIGTSSTFAASGDPSSAVTKIGLFYQRQGAASSAITIYLGTPIYESSAPAIIGGDSTNPANEYHDALLTLGGNPTSGQAPLALYPNISSFQGSGQLMPRMSIQYGDGTNATYVKHSGQSFEFPPQTDTQWRVGASGTSVTVYASASDTIDFSAKLFATDIKQLFTIHASSSTSATYNFSGCSIIGYAPTWKTGVTCTGVTFTNCDTVNFKGASPTNVTVKECHSDVGATDGACSFDANGATLTTSTIDVTGTSAGYHISLGASVTSITLNGNTFTGTPGTDKIYSAFPETTVASTALVTGTRYKIKTAGTTTWTSVGAANNNVGTEFTATGTAAGTGDAYAGVTITWDGVGTSVTSADVTTTGANVPVYIAAPTVNQSVTITGLVAGSRVQIYDTTSSTELSNTTPAGTSVTWTDANPAVASRAIRVRITKVSGTTAYEMIEANIGTCGTTAGTDDISYLANQTLDATYNTNAIDGSLVAGITISDATDRVTINIAGGAVTWPQIYAYQVYWLNTATGIQDDFAFIEAPDTANYLVTTFKIKNTSSPPVPLVISSGYGRDSTTGASVDLVDTTGGTLIFAPDHVVAYSSGSGLTAGQDANLSAIKSATDAYLDATVSSRLPTASYSAPPSAATIATQVLTSAQSTPIHSDAKKMNGATITGAGTSGDKWRGA